MVRDVIYGSIEHLAWGVLTGRDVIDVDATAEALVALVLDGIAVPSRSGPPPTRSSTRSTGSRRSPTASTGPSPTLEGVSP